MRQGMRCGSKSVGRGKSLFAAAILLMGGTAAILPKTGNELTANPKAARAQDGAVPLVSMPSNPANTTLAIDENPGDTSSDSDATRVAPSENVQSTTTEGPRIISIGQGVPFSPNVRGQCPYRWIRADNKYHSTHSAAYEALWELTRGAMARGVGGGLDADTYDWRDINSGCWYGLLGGKFTTLEFLQHARDYDADPMITANMFGGGYTDEDRAFVCVIDNPDGLAADWIRYTNIILQNYRQGDEDDMTGENLRVYNSISDWGGRPKLLAPDEESVPRVKYWQIGNEPEVGDMPRHHINHGLSPTEYRDRYKLMAPAMLAVDPTIKLGPCLTGYGAQHGEWLPVLAAGPDIQIDFVSYHPYYNALQEVWGDTDAMTAALRDVKHYLLQMSTAIRSTMTDAGRSGYELIASEWNPVSWSGAERMQSSMANAIGVVESVFTFAEDGVDAATFWQEPQRRLGPTGAFTGLVEHMGDVLVTTSAQLGYPYDASNFRIYVTRDSEDDSRLMIWGLNFNDQEPVTVNLGLSPRRENISATLKRFGKAEGGTTLKTYTDMVWSEQDVTAGFNPADFPFTMQAAEITVLVLEYPCSKSVPDVDADDARAGALRIGWATTCITPEVPVVMSGGRRARISTGIMDPITVTALVLESVTRDGETAELVAQVSVELSSLREDVMRFIREKMDERVPQIDPSELIVYATHTHAAPDSRPAPALAAKLAELGIEVPSEWSWWGIDLGVSPTPQGYAEFVAERVVQAVEEALKKREPGGVSFGLGHAVVGHNRLTAYYDGKSRMYGNTNTARFSHVEGHEDHSVGLLYTYDADSQLTGVVVNVACPAQVSEGGTLISADYWHETRDELRRRLGESLYILPQIAAAGDQSPHVLVDHRGEERMQQIMFPDTQSGRRSLGRRKQIARRISDAVTSVLPYMNEHIDWNPVLAHRVEQVELTRLRINEEELERIRQNFDRLLNQYTKMRQAIEEEPERKQKADWYNDITPIYWNLRQAYRVVAPYELQQPTISVPVHAVRIGDVAIATNPFELYLDYGMQIRARSKAVQTFTVQLCNGGYGYLPTKRSVAGGAYGAIPESNEVGPEGGRELVEKTLEMIDHLFSLEE